MHSADYMLSQDVRPSVCPSVCHTPVFYRNDKTYHQTYFTVGYSHTILVFPYKPVWQYSDGGVECRGGMKKIVLFWMTLSDVARYSMTRSIARSLCDSWASCSIISAALQTVRGSNAFSEQVNAANLITAVFLENCWLTQKYDEETDAKYTCRRKKWIRLNLRHLPYSLRVGACSDLLTVKQEQRTRNCFVLKLVDPAYMSADMVWICN